MGANTTLSIRVSITVVGQMARRNRAAAQIIANGVNMNNLTRSQSVMLWTDFSFDDNKTISDWIASGVDDIFIAEHSKMVVITLNDGNRIYLGSKKEYV